MSERLPFSSSEELISWVMGGANISVAYYAHYIEVVLKLLHQLFHLSSKSESKTQSKLERSSPVCRFPCPVLHWACYQGVGLCAFIQTASQSGGIYNTGCYGFMAVDELSPRTTRARTCYVYIVVWSRNITMRSKCTVWRIVHNESLYDISIIFMVWFLIWYLHCVGAHAKKSCAHCLIKRSRIKKDKQMVADLRASLKAASPISAIIFNGCPNPNHLSILPVSYLAIRMRLTFRFFWCRSWLIVAALYPWRW